MDLPLSSEQVPDRDVADHDAALSEFVGQGSNRKVWLIADAAQQPIALRLEDRPAMTADLARSNTARCSIALHQLDRCRFADAEPLGGGAAR